MLERGDAVVEASVESMRRREALLVYLEQLEDARKSGGDLREALAGVDLDNWELDQLGRGLDGPQNIWRALIAEGVAFRNKFETDLGWLPSGQELSADDAQDIRRLLVTNAALGIALLDEIQDAVNALILCGDLDDAKKLTGFRNKIGQSVKSLKDRVGQAGFEEARSLSQGLITPAEQASWTDPNTDTPFAPARAPHAPASHAPASRIVFKAKTEPHSHVKPLLMVFGLMIAIWGVFIVPRITSKPLPELTMQDVAPRSAIRHVVARPPSLFVKLKGSEWNALSRGERLALVDDVGRTATAAGYHGVQFTLEDGSTAAQWLQEHGSRLTD